MRVDIATSGSLQSYETSKTEHQRSVLQQYTVETEDEFHSASAHHQSDVKSSDVTDNRRANRLEEETQQYHHRGKTEDSQTLDDDGGFHVPTPQRHLSETWESSKSLPSRTYSSSRRPHSCHHSEVQKQASKMEPYLSLIHI